MEAELVKRDTSLEMKRAFAVPLSLLYQAWTDPAMMNGWFHPNPQLTSVCIVDLRVGGRYEVQMHPPQGDPYIVAGVYREIIPDEKLVFTWQWQGDEEAVEMLITLMFRAVSDMRSELTLRHERFPNEEERDSHQTGWDGTFDQLAAVLE